MNILYITFADLELVNSGSSLRPKRMHEELKKLADEFYVLSGEQGNDDRKTRKESIKRVEKEIKDKKIDLCYIESSTYPIMLGADIRLIKKLVRHGIPTGYFYRDCYRHNKFRSLIKRTSFMGRLKDKYLDMLQARTDKLLERLDVIYFPSTSMSDMFNYRNKHILPPAVDKFRESEAVLSKHVGIYVGGISEMYGIKLMIDAYNMLNQKEDTEYKLILVCRESELADYSNLIDEIKWIEVVHASGEKLESVYERADYALIPRLGGYNDIAVPVKLYEYISHDLPIVSTDTVECKKIVQENNLGLICEQNAESLAQTIRILCSDDERYNLIKQDIRLFVERGNTWTDRAKKVCNDLYRGI